MDIPWQDAELFLAVADHGSFSAAARTLRVAQPTVSRRIAALEEVVGRPLFRRDSGGAHLTAEGERLVEAARQMARWSAEMGRLASGWEDTPSGTVRIATPPGYAFEMLVPLVARSAEVHPDLRFELICGIEHIDLTRGDADLAVRTRLPSQAELVVLLSLEVEVGVFAAPSLASKYPGVVSAAELPWVTWGYPLEHIEPRPYLEAQLEPFRIGFTSNDYLVQRRAVEAGLGAFILPRARNPDDPWSELVELQTELDFPPQMTHVVCARSMRQVPRVRKAVELITGSVERLDGVRVRPGEA